MNVLAKLLPPVKGAEIKVRVVVGLNVNLSIKRSGKEYKQYWYHYEEWREGNRLTKKSRYIPKRLVARVEKMEVDKVSVGKILEVLFKRD